MRIRQNFPSKKETFLFLHNKTFYQFGLLRQTIPPQQNNFYYKSSNICFLKIQIIQHVLRENAYQNNQRRQDDEPDPERSFDVFVQFRIAVFEVH